MIKRNIIELKIIEPIKKISIHAEFKANYPVRILANDVKWTGKTSLSIILCL